LLRRSIAGPFLDGGGYRRIKLLASEIVPDMLSEISFAMRTSGINVNRCGQSRKFDFESRRVSGKLTNGNSFGLSFAS